MEICYIVDNSFFNKTRQSIGNVSGEFLQVNLVIAAVIVTLGNRESCALSPTYCAGIITQSCCHL